MKRIKLFILGTLLSLAAFCQTSAPHYKYYYDNAGNIISRFITFLRNEHSNMFADEAIDNNGEDDIRLTVRTDASWSSVQIEIDGEIASGDMLSVYTSEGFFVKSFRIASNSFSLNLSSLREGTYLFRFRINKTHTYKKFIKER